VLDLAGLAGAYATRLFADLGADVIRIESDGVYDSLRASPPFAYDRPSAETSLEFLHFGANKRSVLLDPATDAGREAFHRLLESADVLVTGEAVNTLARWGFGFEGIRTRYPRLVHASMTPFGLTGPKSSRTGSDLVAAAAGGVLYLIGEPSGPPVRLGADQMYHLGSLYLASAVMIALFERRRTGQGSLIDVSLQEVAYSITGDRQLAINEVLTNTAPRRTGNQTAHFFPYRNFECRDGWVTICALEPAQWLALSQWIHATTSDARILDSKYHGRGYVRAGYATELMPLIQAFAQLLGKDQLSQEGQRRGIPIMPANTIADLVTNEQLVARSYFRVLDHQVFGPARFLGAPYRLGAGGWSLEHAAPVRGEHTDQLLMELEPTDSGRIQDP
jgi:crotonobetainyl-CoA:carnitine CoA-transferase CaiB-like acyl-CoA transferase